jgi:hypothetical protein
MWISSREHDIRRFEKRMLGGEITIKFILIQVILCITNFISNYCKIYKINLTKIEKA